VSDPNPYDELPYCDYPIAQTAPEALAMVSLFHGGPRLEARACRVLELGCAGGANLLPMAWYRPGCRFVGVDNSAVQVERARAARDALGLENVTFMHGDFDGARRELDGPFDLVIAHGVFSWVEDGTRDTLLATANALLTDAGLLYLNYNALPGWNVRGMVRDFLLAQTAAVEGLAARAEHCRALAAAVIEPLGQGDHPYTQLLEREFRMVLEHEPAYVAHEYLAPVNRPYWQSEFEQLALQAGFEVVAEASFNGLADRIIGELTDRLEAHPLLTEQAGDAADLLCYSQMRSPVLARAPLRVRPSTDREFADLWLASSLKPGNRAKGAFEHPDGRVIETGEAALVRALERLAPIWPRAERLADLFPNVPAVREDLELLYRAGLVVLRTDEPGRDTPSPEPLHRWERERHGLCTQPWHLPEG